MEKGSIAEVVARLELWCRRRDRGLARVEWDSVYARQEVISRLRASARVTELEVPSDGSPFENVASLLARMGELPAGEVVSITGIEGIFPDDSKRLDTLVSLSFQRERLASFKLKQIWWVPSHLSHQFVLGVPDLDSWFQLRLELREVPARNEEQYAPLTLGLAPSADENRAQYLLNEFRKASENFDNTSISDFWHQLARPAYEALKETGEAYEASQILIRFSAIAERIQESIDARTAADLIELAIVLAEDGNDDLSRHWLERVLALSRKSLGEEHELTLFAMNKLAMARRRMGDLEAARQLQQEAVAASRRVLGENHPITLTAMSNFAAMLRDGGELEAARELQERVLGARVRLLGSDDPSTIKTMNSLAFTLLDLGDLAGARDMQESVLAATRRVWGDEHPETLSVMNNLATTLREIGDLGAARRMQERVVESTRRALGDEHPDTLGAMNNQAMILLSEGDIAPAIELEEKVVRRLRQILGPRHPNTVSAVNNLIGMLRGQGDLKGAEALKRESESAEGGVIRSGSR